MINTFKPFFRVVKRYDKTHIHDWFSVGFYACNVIQLSITMYGYGFYTGIKIFDVMKLKDYKEEGK